MGAPGPMRQHRRRTTLAATVLTASLFVAPGAVAETPAAVDPPELALELALGDMIFNVYGDPGGNYGLMMQLAVSLWADAELLIDSDGLIQFGLGEADHIDRVVVRWPNGRQEEIVDVAVDNIYRLVER